MGIYAWFTATPPKSWAAHGLVALAVSVACAVFSDPAIAGYVSGASVALVFYGVKEYLDMAKYKRNQSWRKPRWRYCTPQLDCFGDLAGPVMNFVTASLIALLI